MIENIPIIFIKLRIQIGYRIAGLPAFFFKWLINRRGAEVAEIYKINETGKMIFYQFALRIAGIKMLADS